MLRALKIQDEKLVETDGPDAPVLVYVAPTEAERKELVERFHLDEHTLNSSLDPDELSRLEFEPDHAAMILKRPKSYCSEDNFLFKVGSTGAFLFSDRLILVVAEEAPLFDGRRYARVRSLQDVILKILYRSIFHFEEHLRVIHATSAAIEQEINTAMENKHLLSLFTLEKSLVYYLNAINSNATLIEKLKMSAPKIGLTPEHLENLDDVIIENNQCREQARIYSDILASLMDARASIVANNLNVLMKTLNLIMIALMLPTLVVSIFSMNVLMPIPHDHPLAFWFVMVLVAVSVTAVAVIWKKKRL